MGLRDIMGAFVIVLIIMALITGALNWPDWVMFVGTGIVIIPLLYFGMKKQ